MIDDGDLDTAREVFHKSLDLFPDNAIPMGFAGIDMLRYAMVLNETDTVKKMSNQLYATADEWLSYVADKSQLKLGRRTQLHLYTLNELTRLYHQAGDLERARKFNELFEKYYSS